MDNQETEYYKSVCYIQDKFIKGEISREEMEKKLEFERQNQIIFLTQKVEKSMVLCYNSFHFFAGMCGLLINIVFVQYL